MATASARSTLPLRRSSVRRPFAPRAAVAAPGGETARRPVAARPGKRAFVVGGNWKANGDSASVLKLVAGLNDAAAGLHPECEVLVAPPFLHLLGVAERLNPRYGVAAQDCHFGGNGAYTGEVTAAMLKDAGVPWVILGHSERRADRASGYGVMANETNDLVGKKCATALGEGLSVVVCVGETLEQRKADETLEVCCRQLASVAAELTLEQWERVVIAYEPVWAIGTGEVATPEQAQEVHAGLREWIAEFIGEDVAAAVRIQYGGSVKPLSANDLAAMPDIDGFLVGGASLNAGDFAAVCNAAAVKSALPSA